MKKITELREKRFRTNYVKDAFGNRKKVTEEFIDRRTVKTIGSGPRFGHFFVDLICFRILIWIVNFVLLWFIKITESEITLGLAIAFISLLASLLLFPFLYFVCEYFWQKTPGKFLTKTIVIDEYGNKPDVGSLLLRSLVRLVPFEAFSCLGDPSRGWHDKWSNTYVVKETELEEIKKLLKEQE